MAVSVASLMPKMRACCVICQIFYAFLTYNRGHVPTHPPPYRCKQCQALAPDQKADLQLAADLGLGNLPGDFFCARIIKHDAVRMAAVLLHGGTRTGGDLPHHRCRLHLANATIRSRGRNDVPRLATAIDQVIRTH